MQQRQVDGGGGNGWGRCTVWCDELGVTAIEYGLVAALIALVCIGAFSATGVNLGAMYTVWTNAVGAAL